MYGLNHHRTLRVGVAALCAGAYAPCVRSEARVSMVVRVGEYRQPRDRELFICGCHIPVHGGVACRIDKLRCSLCTPRYNKAVL